MITLTGAAPVLRVRQVLYRPKKGGTWQLLPPKTKLSRRTIPLEPSVVAALLAHRNRHQVERMVAGSDYTDYGFVFAKPTGEPLNGTVVSQQWSQR